MINMLSIRDDLARRFNKQEFGDLCLELDVNYDALRGEGLIEKATELLLYLERRRELERLLQICRRLRPMENWGGVTTNATGLPRSMAAAASGPALRGNEQRAVEQMTALQAAYASQSTQQPDPLIEGHYRQIIQAIKKGQVTPFMGRGVNSCGRSEPWQPEQDLPTREELASYLVEKARELQYPPDAAADIVQVAQYIYSQNPGFLTNELCDLFDRDYPPTPVHQFLAALPGVLRAKGYPPSYQIIVTTNYDDTLERAFQLLDEPVDVVAYFSKPDVEQSGRFVHWPYHGEPCLVDPPNEYQGLPLDATRTLPRPVIIKVLGGVDRRTQEWHSFVINEDQYVEYLSRMDIVRLLPSTLLEKILRTGFLFLGSSLRWWDLRVILHRISREQKVKYNSWAIKFKADPVEQTLWNKRALSILSISLEDYIGGLSQRILAQPQRGETSA